MLDGRDPRKVIMVTHLPPWGVSVAIDSRSVGLGNAQLRSWVEAFQPAALACGHVHLLGARTFRVGQTLIVDGGRVGYLLQFSD